MSTPELDRELLASVSASLGDDALAPRRASALRALADNGLPTTRHEDFRYTSLAPAIELGNAWLAARAAGELREPLAAAAQPVLPALDAHFIVLADGLVDEVALMATMSACEGAVTISRLRDSGAELAAETPLDALNAALLQDGLHLRVMRGKALVKPLVIVHHDGAVAASQARILIEVEEGASIEVFEYHAGGFDAATYANPVTELRLAANARASHVRLQTRHREHVQTGRLLATLGRDAVFRSMSFDFGGRLVRHDSVVDIAAPGAEAHLDGLYLVDGAQHVDNHTRRDHRVGPAASHEEFRGILAGRARAVWNGKAIVHEGADGTDAQQANHNLLLSERAEIDTKPELEIYADDVKCSHGATVGQLDPTALHYLRTRGLDREQAAYALTRAFAGALLAKQPIAALDDFLAAELDRRLDELLGEDAA